MINSRMLSPFSPSLPSSDHTLEDSERYTLDTALYLDRIMSSTVLRAPKIALLSGSLRKASWNTTLVLAAGRALTRLGAPTSGVETTFVDLKDYADLPLYNEDLEVDGKLPEKAMELKAVLDEADAFVVASPEYNGWPSSVLVNAYTWCSRGDDPSNMYATFRGKSALVLSTSPGPLGGMRTLDPHRQLLTNLGVTVVPGSVAIGAAYKAFNEEGDLVDEKQIKMLDSSLMNLFEMARAKANREALGQIVRNHIAGQYGSLSLPGEN